MSAHKVMRGGGGVVGKRLVFSTDARLQGSAGPLAADMQQNPHRKCVQLHEPIHLYNTDSHEARSFIRPEIVISACHNHSEKTLLNHL